MLRPSPNHGTQRLPNDDDDDDLHFRYYSTGMVKYFFDLNFYHYIIQHPIFVPEV